MQNEPQMNANLEPENTERPVVGTERIIEEKGDDHSPFVNLLINMAMIALFAIPLVLAFVHSQQGETPWGYAVKWFRSVVERERQNIDEVK